MMAAVLTIKRTPSAQLLLLATAVSAATQQQ